MSETRLKPETALLGSIQKELIKQGFFVIRVHSGKVRVRGGYMQLAPNGTPDLHIVGQGWLECKVPGQKLRDEQTAWHLRARAHHVRVETVESVGQAVEVAMRWRTEMDHERSMGWR